MKIKQPVEPTSEFGNLHRDLVLAVGAFIITIALLLLDSLFSKESLRVLSSGRGKLWLFISTVKTVYAIVVARYAYSIVRELHVHYKTLRFRTSSLTFILVIFPLFLPVHGLLGVPTVAAKFILLTIIAAAVSSLAIDGIMLIHRRFVDLANLLDEDHVVVAEYLDLRSKLQYLIVLSGILIGLSALAASTMRAALISTVGLSIPFEYVFIYGAYFTCVLAITSLPTYVKCIETGQKLLEHYYPLQQLPFPKAERPHDVSWYECRQNFRGILQLDRAYSFMGVNGFSILSPVLGSLAGILIGIDH